MDKNGVFVVRDPMEDELLAALEELAQKTDVLTHWADQMYEAVKAVPQSQSSSPPPILCVVTDVSQSPFLIPPSLRVGKVKLKSMLNDGGTQIRKQSLLL